MDIALRIKYLLSRKKLEQKDLAKALNVSPKTAHNYLNGHTKITADQIPQIAIFLKVPIEYLFKDDSSKPYPEVDDKLTEANDTPPDYSDKPETCKNPECIKRIKELEEDKRRLQDFNDLLKEKIPKGGTDNGKSSKGGVDESRAAG